MSNDEAVLEAARAIRPYLTDLVGHDARALDTELAGLLGEATAGRDVEEPILSALERHDATHAWAARFLEAGLPEEIVRLAERSASLPGLPAASPAPRFDCPLGDYTWYRRSLADLVPDCPTHKLSLAPHGPQG